MKYAILAAMSVTWVLLGATCVPLIDLDNPSTVTPTTELAVSIMKPSTARSIPLGAVVDIEWTAVNLTGDDALATVLVRRRGSLTDTILAGGLRLPESGGTRTQAWDTTGFEGGEYSILVRVEAADKSDEASAPARITINSPPEFEFTEPTDDTELGAREEDPNDPNAADESDGTTTIRWTSFDRDGDGTAKISVDPDQDHDSGNEIVINEVSIPATSGFESMKWDGTSSTGDRVDADTYYIFAAISDELNEERIVDGLARITVPEEPNAITLEITKPAEDTEFLATDADPLEIAFTIDESKDVLIDLEIDPDDNHTNGNEQAVLSQRLIEKGTNEDSFDWDGDDVSGDPVKDGIYKILLLVNRESGTPQTVTSSALVFRRSTEDQPLIAIIEPSSDKTVKAGEFVFIKWRDDDPSESATIRLWIDDDDIANQVLETDEDPIEIMPEPRDAKDDGVLDTFNYRVPSDLNPGRYYVFAFIDRDDAGTTDHVSLAAGQIVIEDPNSSN